MSIPINENQAAMMRICKLLTARKISLREFADRMGVLPSHISNWKKRGIPTDRLRRAADVLGISIDDIVGRTEGIPEGAIPVLLTGRVPVIGRAKLGDDGDFADVYSNDDNNGFLPIPSDDPHAYAVQCVGTSMMPRIQPGEFVLAEPSFEPMPGDEVVVEDLDGRRMVKRYLYWRENNLFLGSVNEQHGSVVIPAEKVKSIHPVLAIVPKKLWKPF